MILSDDPAWRARAQHRRPFCLADAPWIAVAEVGWPHKLSELAQLLDSNLQAEIWTRSQVAANNYLRATGMAATPSWVFGVGVRAIWLDEPGRWFVAHASTDEIMNAARAHFAGAPSSSEPKLFTTRLNGLSTQIVQRNVGEPAATQGDVLKAGIALAGIDPAYCFGASAYALPTMVRTGESNSVASIDDCGLSILTPLMPSAWHDEFRRRQPHTVPPSGDLMGPTGPIRVERFKWTAMHDRAAAGDATVPQSPIELAVSFVETVGIHGSECWGISERQPGTTRSSAYAQVVYRPRVEHDAGRQRFHAYLDSIRVAQSDLDLGHPEGYIAMDWAGIRVIKPY